MTAQQLKNSILQMAVQGKLVPQDPSDEPASVLLERIREEKKRLVKEGKIKAEKNPSFIFRGADNLPYEKVGDKEPVCIADEVPFEIPESWEWVRLGYIINLQSGQDLTPDKYNDAAKGIPYITGASNIENGKVIVNRWTEYGRAFAYKDELLLTCKGTVGTMAFLKEEKVHIARQIMAIHPSACISPGYLQIVLETLVEGLKAAAKSMIPGISREDVLTSFVPLPSMSEQNKITKKVYELLPHIEAYDKKEKAISALNADFPMLLKKSILQQAVMGKLVSQDENDEPAGVLLERIRAEKKALVNAGKLKKDLHESIIYRRDNSHYEKLDGVERCIDNEIPYDIPYSWEWGRLSTIGYKITDGTHKTPLYVDNGIKFVSAQNIARGYLCFDKCKYITAKEHSELYQRCNPEKGDIMISKSGSIGMAVINDASFEFSMFESLALLKYPQNYMCGDYLRIAIQSACWTLTENEIRGVAVKHLPIAFINRILVPIPPLSEQQRIVSAYIKLSRVCDNINTGGI